MLVPFDGIATLLNGVMTRIWPDKSQEIKQQFDLAMQQLAQEGQIAQAQITVNAAEATSDSWMARNWRPLTGIFCAMSFGWTYFFQPLVTYFFVIAGHTAPVLPVFAMDQMMPVLFGLLGLGAYRSYEKVRLK